MSLASDTLIVKDLLAAMFESALGVSGSDANDRAKAVIEGFFPGAFSGIILSKQFTITGGVQTVAGVGTGADTDGTARVYNVGTALPAGALFMGYQLDLNVAFVGNATLDLQVGVTGAADDICDASDMMGTPGHTQGTPGTLAAGIAPVAPQVIATLTPDGSSKVSEGTVGEVVITVFYMDAT